MTKVKTDRAIVVEGRDDVSAVSRAVEALIIPTHGFGITKETWQVLENAYREKGLIILTDPDFSGEEIRSKLTGRFPEALQAYIAQDDALAGDDIGVENAVPEVIAAAVERALLNEEKKSARSKCADPVTMAVLSDFGLVGCDGSGELRQAVCKKLGIGYGNGRALVRKLELWGIGTKELEQTIKEIKQQ